METNAFDLAQRLHRLDQAAALVARQIDLSAIAGDNALRVLTEPGQKHEHLLGRRILCFIQNNKRLAERSSAHVGERRDLDDSAIHVLLNLLHL